MPNATKVVTNHRGIVNHFNEHLVQHPVNQVRRKFARTAENSVSVPSPSTSPFPTRDAFVEARFRNCDLGENASKQFPVNWKAVKTWISRFTIGKESFLSLIGRKRLGVDCQCTVFAQTAKPVRLGSVFIEELSLLVFFTRTTVFGYYRSGHLAFTSSVKCHLARLVRELPFSCEPLLF